MTFDERLARLREDFLAMRRMFDELEESLSELMEEVETEELDG